MSSPIIAIFIFIFIRSHFDSIRVVSHPSFFFHTESNGHTAANGCRKAGSDLESGTEGCITNGCISPGRRRVARQMVHQEVLEREQQRPHQRMVPRGAHLRPIGGNCIFRVVVVRATAGSARVKHGCTCQLCMCQKGIACKAVQSAIPLRHVFLSTHVPTHTYQCTYTYVHAHTEANINTIQSTCTYTCTHACSYIQPIASAHQSPVVSAPHHRM